MAYATKHKKNLQVKALIQTRRDGGLCRRCPKPAVEGRTLCEYHRDYAKRFRGNVDKDKARQSSKKLRDKMMESIFSHYGQCCACCGEKHKEFLTIDHVNGDGADRRREGVGSGYALRRWLIRNDFPDGYRILCSNCNLAMGIHGKCPHDILEPQMTNHPGNPFQRIRT